MADKSPRIHTFLSVIGTLVAVGGLYLGYLQFIKPDPREHPVTVDPAWKIKSARIKEIQDQIYELNTSIAARERKKTDFEAEMSSLYQKDPSEMSTDELRDVMKRREDANRNLDEMKAAIQELVSAREKLQDKLDALVK